MEQIFTVDEAAEYLKVRPETVRRLLSQGRLPGNKVGRAWRIPEGALMTFLRGEEDEVEIPRIERARTANAPHQPLFMD